MQRFILVPSAVLTVLLALATSHVQAQNTYPFRQPNFGPGWHTPLSPYLNLLIPGNSAVDYYALTLPQFQRRQYRNQMMNQLQGLGNMLPQRPQLRQVEIGAPMYSAGHPTVFGYTGHWYGGINQSALAGGSPFQQRFGGNTWPRNAPQPAGKAPKKRR